MLDESRDIWHTIVVVEISNTKYVLNYYRERNMAARKTTATKAAAVKTSAAKKTTKNGVKKAPQRELHPLKSLLQRKGQRQLNPVLNQPYPRRQSHQLRFLQ